MLKDKRRCGEKEDEQLTPSTWDGGNDKKKDISFWEKTKNL